MPNNIVSWWAGESNTLDNLGINNGIYEGTPAYAPGRVGTAFNFNGANQYVLVSNSPSLQFSGAITVEAWVYLRSYNSSSSSSIMNMFDAVIAIGEFGWSFGVDGPGPGFFGVSTNGTSANFVYTTSHCPLNTWTHLAATYDGNNLVIYFNGVQQGSVPLTGNIFPTTDNFGIGAVVGGGQQAAFFNGLIDEAAVYNRALSAGEIQAIYAAGSAGKCPLPISIINQPASTNVYPLQPAFFNVSASGSQPIAYQWYFNGTNINGATGSTLTVSYAQPPQAGSYYVALSNAASSVPVTSAVATLTVMTAPSCEPLPAEIVSWWSGESNAVDNLGTNDGIFVGMPSYAPGMVGYAFDFNGTSQFIRVSNSPSLVLSNAITAEVWVYPTAYNSSPSATILCKYGAYQNGQSSWCFYIDGGGHGGCLVSTNGTSGAGGVSTTDVCPLNTWTHLAFTYDGQNLEIYFNGNLEDTTNVPGPLFPGTYDLGIGANVGGVANNQAAALFAGLIDEPAIFRRALSAGEIQAIYNAGAAGICQIAPTFVTQPTSESVFVGGNALFTTAAYGSQPMTYQWQFAGTNIAGATGTSLFLTNLNMSQSGAYSVAISNLVGGAVPGSNAMLNVLPLPPCEPAPSNIVSWWPGQSNAYDDVGGNNGTLVGSPVFAQGEVGLAFDFNGSSQFVRVPDAPNLHFSNAMTLEAWVYPTAYNAQSSAILCKYDAPDSPGGQASWSFSVNSDGHGVVLISTNGSTGITLFTTNVCPLNTWTHLAATYDSTALKIYFNAALQSSTPMFGNLFQGTDDVGIGANVGGVPNSEAAAIFAGLIDEPAVYNRALSSNEIAAIFNAGPSGKCAEKFPAQVYFQPVSQSVYPGATVTFTAAASGSPVLGCQWNFNSSPLSGATNRSLTLSNVTVSNGGTYTFTATNNINSAQSSNATLEILLVTVYGNNKPLTNAQYTFTNSVTISMTNYYNNGYIFFTTNGTAPTPDSPLYTGSFLLTSSAVIQTLGYSADFSQSAVSAPVTVTLPTSYILTAATAGGGSISLSPTGSNYLANTPVTLTATASNGWTFLQWLGDAGGASATNTVLMDRNKSVQAVFGTAVSTAVGGSGSILLNPAGSFYPYGTILQATAVPQPGNFLVFWGDAASGEANPLSFHVTNANPTISALFYTLNGGEVSLAVVPIGHGTVTVNPPTNTYAAGTVVTITATPASGHVFLGWSGAAAGTNNPLNYQLNESATIDANFTTNNSMVIYLVTPPNTGDGMAIDLNGETGVQYRLDASANFSNWTTLYNLTNAVGTIHYIDINAANLPRRFYRGITIVP